MAERHRAHLDQRPDGFVDRCFESDLLRLSDDASVDEVDLGLPSAQRVDQHGRIVSVMRLQRPVEEILAALKAGVDAAFIGYLNAFSDNADLKVVADALSDCAHRKMRDGGNGITRRVEAALLPDIHHSPVQCSKTRS